MMDLAQNNRTHNICDVYYLLKDHHLTRKKIQAYGVSCLLFLMFDISHSISGFPTSPFH